MCFPSKKQKKNFNDDAPMAKSQSGNPPAMEAKETDNMMSSGPRVAIVIYSMYGHIAKLAESVKAGIKEAGGHAEIYQIAETLSSDVLGKLQAPPKPNYPIFGTADLLNFDAYLFGIPTRFGNMPGQWKAFWDTTGGHWFSGALAGKFAGVFVSTATLGGGQEQTVANTISTFAHHGIIFVPLGYKYTGELMNVDEVHGGSPWGAGTIASPTGARQPSPLELEVAKKQGSSFYQIVSKHKF
ncbi:hypothetical protein AX15_006575 [Amanita polypyramis BW_CC]|nr:hypothetical protein AX15_006575 [Amanita polypyramis BW_CC]